MHKNNQLQKWSLLHLCSHPKNNLCVYVKVTGMRKVKSGDLAQLITKLNSLLKLETDINL